MFRALAKNISGSPTPAIRLVRRSESFLPINVIELTFGFSSQYSFTHWSNNFPWSFKTASEYTQNTRSYFPSEVVPPASACATPPDEEPLDSAVFPCSPPPLFPDVLL